MHDLSKIIVQKSREFFGDGFIPLHRPVFYGNEKEYLAECIDSNFVSSVGKMVNKFEESLAEFVGADFAVATVNGTAGLQLGLVALGVRPNDEVITQSLTFVATANAIRFVGAHPVFVDVDRDTLGLSPTSMEQFLLENAELVDGVPINKTTRRRISACIPMHTFGNPCRVAELKNLCANWNIKLLEDAAESLGSYENGRHVGLSGDVGVFSFNGNKLITTGGGGMLVTNSESLAKHAKHLSTTAKMPHEYEFVHDEVGFNFRMPNLNAALGVAQIERIEGMLLEKSKIADSWRAAFSGSTAQFLEPIDGCKSNNWLCALVLDSREQRDIVLKETNQSGVMTRPIWTLMSELTMYKQCQAGDLFHSYWLQDRVINIPSSVP